jgi:glycerophosphoryl diester phosphodiesterase
MWPVTAAGHEPPIEGQPGDRRAAVQVVAHRGSSDEAPEHTLSAYKRALADGADALECDVRLTKDGHLVCVHDRRIDRTSNGRGILSTLELAELTELDWGSWRDSWEDLEDPEIPDRDRSQILTLRRLLEAVAELDHRVEVAIETKHPTRYAGLVELTLAELLTRHGLVAPNPAEPVTVRVMSFAGSSLRRLRSLAPALPTVYLMHRLALRHRDGVLPAGAYAVGPSLRALTANPTYVERVHDAGGEVHVWTVDDPADVDHVTDLGVDVIITNRPRAVLAQLQARAADSSRLA